MNNHVDNYRLTEVTVAIPPTHYYIKDIMNNFTKSKNLTAKQENMIVERLKDKTATNATIIKRAGYKAKNNHTAAQLYLENMKKPEISNRLEPVVDEIEDILITTVRKYKDSDKQWEQILANDNAKWIHDKVKGKATQKIEQQSTSVNISIDLTQTED